MPQNRIYPLIIKKEHPSKLDFLNINQIKSNLPSESNLPTESNYLQKQKKFSTNERKK